ncbi:protein SAR DEFICIENT 4 [Dendrobium catenatum]|uniref:protein SAR DEFICIENT 4 n=1 Tax=Dendrobium catenatum TaxID=906689 RepID=UPI0009F28866|nr:protein SAR DEFICIENT 4 [Dendrobium catenatum]
MSAGAIIGGGCTFLDAHSLRSLLPPSSLIPHFLSSLPSHSAAVNSPFRQSFAIDPSNSSSLLLMPSWSSSPSLPYIGIKIVTSFPHNTSLGLPGISASYVLFSSSTGASLAAIDGTELTLLRTSAVSALAARFLARDDARVLIMVGAGALAPYLIRAHRYVRPGIERVIIWNRSVSKARDLVKRLQEEEKEGGNVVFEHVEILDNVIGIGDVVSCATSSQDPIVKGGKLKPGAHLDLVGSFSPAMRECDDEALVRGRVFVDFEPAVAEAGELVGAFERGTISREDVIGTLVDLAGGMKVGRRSPEEITVFKSVGTAVVDLLAGQLAYETHIRGSH